MLDIPQIDRCFNRLSENINGENDGRRIADMPYLPFKTTQRPRHDLGVFALRKLLRNAQIARQPQGVFNLPQLMNHPTRLRDGDRLHNIPGSEDLRPLLW